MNPFSLRASLSTALLASWIVLPSFPLIAQPARGGGPGSAGPRFHGAVAKLFEAHKGFSCELEMQTVDPSAKGNISVPGKFDFLENKTRFELDLTKVRGASLQPTMAAQIKAMGMGEMTAITRPDKKSSFLIYPGLQAFTEMPLPDEDAASASAKFSVQSKTVGNEKLDGHPCTKNAVVVTDEKGVKHEATVWNATDLKNFPLKVEHKEDGQPVTLLLRSVNLTPPDAARFEAPAGFTKYDSVQALMQGAVMKQLGGGQGLLSPQK